MQKTGATRYQKFLKAEKAKTKLKGKKELPKGTNVTKTHFKVKKIVIKEQLKKHGQTEALSSKKLNAKELLSRLSHFNTNTRTEALNGLKELITMYPDSMEHSLGQFIHSITPMILNVEKVVRRESLKVLQIILSNVEFEKIEPFFNILSTYLRSAMTHIDNRIQEDSLLFLDILLLDTPRLIAHDFYKIIPNFLDMISKSKFDSNVRRTLTVNLNSQITSVKWRVKVFHRLQQFLQKFSEFHEFYKKNHLINKTTHIFDDTIENTFPLFNPIYTTVCSMPGFSSKSQQNTVPLDEVKQFGIYIDDLMNLIFHIWLEACPNVKLEKKTIETVITEDAAILLKHTLEVISLLWNLVNNFHKNNSSCMIQNMFCQKNKALFSQHFVQSFPYVTNMRSKLPKNNDSQFENVITDPKLVVENLEICNLFIELNSHVNVKNQNHQMLPVLNYIEKIFGNCSESSINVVVLKTVRMIFSKEVISSIISLNIIKTLFDKIVCTYFNKHTSRFVKEQIFTLLCEIAIDDKLRDFHTRESYKKWLENLPDILLEQVISAHTIDVIHKFAVTNNRLFNIVLKPKLLSIISNLPKLQIIESSTNEKSYHKLFSLLYWVIVWDDESFKLLESQIMNNEYKSDYGKYIMDVLKCKSGSI